MSEPGSSALGFQKPRLVNRLFYRVMTSLLRGVILRYFRLSPVDAQVVPDVGAGILLSNHSTLFDPIWVYAMLRRPVYFAATEDLFRKRALGRLIRWFGAFPKRKAASDIAALRAIFTLIGTGGLIGVFPEGVRTWDGRNQPLYTGIAKLIQRMAVPVYVCRLEGAYLVYPRWARRWRRLPIRGVFSRLYDSADIPADENRILEDIAEAIRTRDYELPIEPSENRGSGLAVNLTRVLYRCPSCGTLEGLKLVRPYSSNLVECSSCFSSWSVDIGCRLSTVDENGRPEGRWTTLADYYDRVRSMPLTPIRSELRLGLAPGERIFLISRPRFLFKQERFPNLRVFAFGRAFLTSERLLFRTRLGFPLAMPLTSVGALSVDPGDRLHFTYEGKLYRIPFRNESALKWYDTILRQQAEIRARKAVG
ncbi:MAG TPA: lysophospholipid acyltransferase family protein [Spirochaetia bacterium]|nr:lysophospholipid acyltransferase family protein [Spirochaetia bacterium]